MSQFLLQLDTRTLIARVGRMGARKEIVHMSSPSFANQDKLPSSMNFKTMPIPQEFLHVFRESVKQTMTTRSFIGYSIGVIRNSDGSYVAILHPGADSPSLSHGQLIPRPPIEEQSLIHFHTHVKDDDSRGLSLNDVLSPEFQNGSYDYFVVANVAVNELNVYQSPRVMNDRDYGRVIEIMKKLVSDATLSIFKQTGREPEPAYQDLLNQNNITAAIGWLKSQGYVQTAKIMEHYFTVWNAFMSKTRTIVYPIS